MDTGKQCVRCANLTIEHLVDLARKGFSRDSSVPSAACYQLHDSIEDLEIAADAGCHFCNLIKACLNGYWDNNSWIADEWEGEDCHPEHSLLTRARQLLQSEVRLCIVSDDSDRNDALADVKVLDAILVQVGPYDELGGETDDGVERFPVFKLTLASLRGTCGIIAHSGIHCCFTESVRQIKLMQLPWGHFVLDDMR